MVADQRRAARGAHPPSAPARRHGRVPRARPGDPPRVRRDGPRLGLAYMVVIGVHGGLIIRASARNVSMAFRGVAAINAVAALIVLVGGIAGGTVEYLLWAAAFVLTWFGTPRLTDDS